MTIPTIQDKLQPEVFDRKIIRAKDESYKEKYQNNFNKSKRTVILPYLQTGDEVYVTDRSEYGQVEARRSEPRSYEVKLNSGNTIRRNRRALIHTGIQSNMHPQIEKKSTNSSS